MTMLELLGKFREEKVHLAVVSDTVIRGIITMEDVFEQILEMEILDEIDYDKITSVLASNNAQNIPGSLVRHKRRRPFSALHPRLDENSMSIMI